MSAIDVISDHANLNLNKVPEQVLEMYNLKMLYLEGNNLQCLPEDMFEKLAKLSWLDVRNNKLQTIPTGIAYHGYLETLLLQDNQIEKLPDELGLVPNLKVLQISGNPVCYPPQDVIEDGVRKISQFLRAEYYKNRKDNEEEHELQVTELNSSNAKSEDTKQTEKFTVQDLLRLSAPKRVACGVTMPVIKVKGLSKNPPSDKVKSQKPGKTHKMTTNCSKISLRSCYNSNRHAGIKKAKEYSDRVDEQEMKELWLGRLRELLADQEKILQQERNLRALSKWRFEKLMEEPRPISEAKISQVPYDTDPDCNRILSREDIAKEVNRVIKRSKKPSKKQDIQKLINDVVEQLKGIEGSKEKLTPRREKEIAAKEIESIIELHRRIVALQASSDSL